MSSNSGGYLRGPWWRYQQDDDKTRRCFVIAWGQIVREPSEKYKDLRTVRFAIKTGRGAGRNEKHLVCVSWGESQNAVIMRAMEKGDVVLCAGTWVETSYIAKKKGVRRTTYEMQVNFILPYALVGFLLDLYGTPQITEAVLERQNEDADIWESD